MGVNGVRAAHVMLGFRTWRKGHCLEAVWAAYKAVGARATTAAPTATIGWERSAGKHRGDRNPPAGVPVWWGPKPGSAAGDVVISLGGGRVVATDWPYNGVINITTIDARERQIGRPYLGWTEEILGQPIDFDRPDSGGGSVAPAIKENEDMDIVHYGGKEYGFTMGNISHFGTPEHSADAQQTSREPVIRLGSLDEFARTLDNYGIPRQVVNEKGLVYNPENRAEFRDQRYEDNGFWSWERENRATLTGVPAGKLRTAK